MAAGSASDGHLRRPAADQEPPVLDVVLEPLGEPRLHVGVRIGLLDGPDERPLRRLEAAAELNDLLHQQVREAAEADVEHG
jgi:hypothetical protein